MAAAALSVKFRMVASCTVEEPRSKRRANRETTEMLMFFQRRDKGDDGPDNGVWLATTIEHHESLRQEFPHMRSIGVLGKDVTGWQILPATSPDFEESALRASELVMARDPRIGKVPKSKKPRKKA